MSSKPVLYSYWRSSCSWRVRIALNLKGIDYDYRAVNLLSKEAVNSEEFLSANPARKVPALVINGQALTESLAILEYLEEVYPDAAPLLPKDPIKRAQSRAIALQIAAGVQPVQNVRLLKYLNAEEAGKGLKWANHWITDGFRDLEDLLKKTADKYSVGNEVSIADLCIPSIIYNANRFNVNMSEFPTLVRVNENLGQLDAFKEAEPDRQPDANMNA